MAGGQVLRGPGRHLHGQLPRWSVTARLSRRAPASWTCPCGVRATPTPACTLHGVMASCTPVSASVVAPGPLLKPAASAMSWDHAPSCAAGSDLSCRRQAGVMWAPDNVACLVPNLQPASGRAEDEDVQATTTPRPGSTSSGEAGTLITLSRCNSQKFLTAVTSDHGVVKIPAYASLRCLCAA